MTSAQRAEWFVRHAITYPVLRRLFRNSRTNAFVDLQKITSVLILRYDRFGDMIVTSPITRHLKAVNPSLTVGVAASSANAQVAQYLPGVDHIHEVSGDAGTVLSGIAGARRVSYDVVLNFIFNRTSTGGILANLIARRGLKVGQGDKKYAFYFNKLVTLNRGSTHMVNLLDGYCSDVFGNSWGSADLRYELDTDTASERRVELALGGFKEQAGRRIDGFVVLNISAGESRRDLTPDQISRVASALVHAHRQWVILVGAPGTSHMIQRIRQQVRSERLLAYPPSGKSPFMDMVSLIKRASFLISPDTSLVHVASAVKTPVVTLYSSYREFAEWSPVGVRFEGLIEPSTGVVRSIPPKRIIEAFLKLQSRVELSR